MLLTKYTIPQGIHHFLQSSQKCIWLLDQTQSNISPHRTRLFCEGCNGFRRSILLMWVKVQFL